MNKKIQTSLRMSQEAKRLLKQLSEKLGVSQSAIIELAIRKLAKQEGSK
jgi:predicted DNA-binding protein